MRTSRSFFFIPVTTIGRANFGNHSLELNNTYYVVFMGSRCESFDSAWATGFWLLAKLDMSC